MVARDARGRQGEVNTGNTGDIQYSETILCDTVRDKQHFPFVKHPSSVQHKE